MRLQEAPDARVEVKGPDGSSDGGEEGERAAAGRVERTDRQLQVGIEPARFQGRSHRRGNRGERRRVEARERAARGVLAVRRWR